MPDDPVTAYWQVARKAQADGLLTEAEARTIARIGHRKQGYWERHLIDLRELIAERQKKGGPDATNTNA